MRNRGLDGSKIAGQHGRNGVTRRLRQLFAVAVACLSGTLLLAQIPSAAGAVDTKQECPACKVSPSPNALWSLAQCCSRCLQSNPGCREYDATDEYIILKDNSKTKPDSYMIIPTKKVTGIEDPQVFELPFLDFWEYGWQVSQKYPGEPPARIGMAINSEHGRTENQMHIHISCLRPDVRKVLTAKDRKIGNDPEKSRKLKLPPQNHSYRAVKVTGLAGKSSPFEVIQAFPGAKGTMAAQSIALAATPKDGEFYVLDTQYHGKGTGSAEELLDQTCKMPDAQP